MAVHAPIIANATCAPGNVASFAPTRRDVMRGLLPIGLITMPAAAVGSIHNDASVIAWNAAHARWRSARDEAARFDDTVFGPIFDEIMRRAPYPNMSFEIVARSGQSASYHMNPADLDEWADVPAFRSKVVPIRDVYHRFIQDRATAQSDLGYEAAEARKEVLEERFFEAQAALMKVPAPHAAALATKIMIAVQPDSMMCEYETAALLSDAERLGGDA